MAIPYTCPSENESLRDIGTKFSEVTKIATATFATDATETPSYTANAAQQAPNTRLSGCLSLGRRLSRRT